MNVEIGIGLDNIKFGLKEADVVNLIGCPDKVYYTDLGCRRAQYNNLRIELSFEPENENLLGWIEVHNRDAKLFKEKVLGSSKAEVMSVIENYISEAPTYEDYGSFESLTYEGSWLELQFEFDLLKSINFGVLYDPKENPIWPSA